MNKIKNLKIRRGDNVVVLAGKDIGRQGKVLQVDRKNEKVIVEGINMIHRHTKPQAGRAGEIVEKEAPIHVSNVMYLHKGQPTRIGYKVEEVEKDGKKEIVKKRIAKSTGEVIN